MANPNPQSGFKKNPQNINREGRPPKGYSITEWFRQMFEKDPNIKEAIGRSIIKKALEGDSAAQRLVWNYMDGMPPQAVDVTSGGDKIGSINELFAKYGKDNNEDVSKTS
jgi:hypothetical protein